MARSPAEQTARTVTSSPSCSGATGKPGGARKVEAVTESSSGAVAVKSAKKRRTSGASSKAWTTPPARTCGPSGCRRYSSAVTIPKFPPPPRRPQSRSGFSSALAVTRSPSAVMTSAPSRLSHAGPYLRAIQPSPPPRVRPATPVSDTLPVGVARPKACVARSTSPSSAPGLTRAVRATESTSTARWAERSTTTPASHTALPATLWPPPRTARASPCSRAKRTEVTTSSRCAQRAMSAGRRSTMPFQTRRAESYSRSPGPIRTPAKSPSSAPTVASSSTVRPHRGHRIDRNRGASGHPGEQSRATPRRVEGPATPAWGRSPATPPGRGDAAVARRVPSAPDGVLEARAGREARGLGGGDVHRLAGGRVGPLARVTVGDGELAEAGDGDVLAGGQAVLDGSDGGAQRLVGLALAQARALCDLLDELVLVHDGSPPGSTREP